MRLTAVLVLLLFAVSCGGSKPTAAPASSSPAPVESPTPTDTTNPLYEGNDDPVTFCQHWDTMTNETSGDQRAQDVRQLATDGSKLTGPGPVPAIASESLKLHAQIEKAASGEKMDEKVFEDAFSGVALGCSVLQNT